jgi:hypothetical protein
VGLGGFDRRGAGQQAEQGETSIRNISTQGCLDLATTATAEARAD